jgi:hypothetical protein
LQRKYEGIVMDNLDFWIPIALWGFIGVIAIVGIVRLACEFVEK